MKTDLARSFAGLAAAENARPGRVRHQAALFPPAAFSWDGAMRLGRKTETAANCKLRDMPQRQVKSHKLCAYCLPAIGFVGAEPIAPDALLQKLSNIKQLHRARKFLVSTPFAPPSYRPLSNPKIKRQPV
ncbi:hypothetical protein [Methylomonas koyamae]|uniref:hypothetical protein n=1 Tax=Methylomonas koyamae TaxID=702114 RepID=UPI0018E069EC|nr:hypothetical protein [Methylomonas koyamae]